MRRGADYRDAIRGDGRTILLEGAPVGDITTHPEKFDAESGAAYYREALALAQLHGMRPLVAHCHLGLAKLYHRVGKPEEARENLTAATTRFREMGMDFWLEQGLR